MSWFDSKLAICAGVSFVAHYALALGLEQLPKRVEVPPPEKITVTVIEPPKEPVKEEPPPPPPPEPDPTPPPKPVPTATKPVASPPRVAHTPTVAPVVSDTPASEHAVQTSGTDEPVYGVTMESTSQQGGPSVAVGNTLSPAAPSGAPRPAKPAGAAVVPQFEATKLPLPQGRCFGTYTEEAKTAGTEGTVVLDLTVDETGHARDVTVTQGLEHGLSAAAVAALRACKFSPGEKDGKPAAVRIRGFKITFQLADAR